MKKQKETGNLLPGGNGFTLRCIVDQNDQFEADLLGAYGDMLYDKDRTRRQCIGVLIAMAVFSVIILVSRTVVDQYLWFTGSFALLALCYGLYFDKKGYKNEFVQFSKYLNRCIDEGKTIYPEEELTYEFREDRVFFVNRKGITRFILYSDIRYFEQTDRFYIFGLKYLPREARLYDLERVLFTKRCLSPDQERELLELIENITAAYEIEPVIEDHPFK